MSPDEMLLFRRQRRLTQAEFGQSLVPPVSRVTVYNWERSRFAIPKDIVERMVKFMAGTPIKPKKRSEKARDTLANYTKMRSSPNNFTHADILGFWVRDDYELDDEEKLAIFEAYPELQQTKG